jgi:hypothetical protein
MQSQTQDEILSKEMIQDFFTEIHLLSGKLVLVVVIHPLDGSRTN